MLSSTTRRAARVRGEEPSCQRGARRRATLAATLCVLLALVSSACGSRRSHEDALAAARGGVVGSGTNGGGASADDRTDGGSGVAGPGVAGTGGAGGGPGAAGGGGSAGSTSGGTGLTSGGGSAGAALSPGSGASCSGPASTLAIGTVGEQSGIFGPFLSPMVKAIQAWVASVNAQGGVNCHPIKFIVKDDGGDPSVHQSQVQELVEEDHVIAIVGMDAVIAGNASVDYLTQKGVPVIGDEGGSSWFYTSPVYFPQITSGDLALQALVRAIAQIGAPQGKHTLGTVTCVEAALCSSLYGSVPALAQQNHLTLGYRGQASLTQPDFTSSCQSAKSAGVDLFIAGLDTNSIQRLLKNCASIGFNPLYITGGPLITPGLLADPRAEGFYVAPNTDLYTNAANPQIAAMRATLAKFAPGVPPSISATVGWTAAQLFQVALQKATSPTPAALLQALGTIKGNDLGGLTAPLSFTSGQPAAKVQCFWLGQVHDGGLRTPPGQPSGRICV
jgi:branched-chain amino acid transport system substrate-binding protein